MQVLASCNNLTSIKGKIRQLKLKQGTYYISIAGLGQQETKIINADIIVSICEKALKGKLVHAYVNCNISGASMININIYKF